MISLPSWQPSIKLENSMLLAQSCFHLGQVLALEDAGLSLGDTRHKYLMGSGWQCW